MPAFTNDQGTIMMQGKPMENEADTVKGPLPSMKRHCAFRDKSPRGEAASWECVHFKTRPRHAPAPSRMLASIKGVARTGRNAVERRRGVTIGTDCIVRHFCHWSSCPGGMMCSSASTLAAERRRIDRMRKNGSLKGKDALSMRREERKVSGRAIMLFCSTDLKMDRQTDAKSIAAHSDVGITYLRACSGPRLAPRHSRKGETHRLWLEMTSRRSC